MVIMLDVAADFFSGRYLIGIIPHDIDLLLLGWRENHVGSKAQRQQYP